MSNVHVRLVGGPADGTLVVVEPGVSVWRVAEFPKPTLYSDEGLGCSSLLVKTHDYVIGNHPTRGGYHDGIWQG